MTKSSQVEEWIDAATINPKTEEVDSRTGFAWSLYDQLLKFFAVLIPLVPIDRSSTQSKKYKKSLKDSMGKLLLLGDEYRDGRLETILEKSDDLKETILETLVYIGNTLVYSLFPVCKITSHEHQAGHNELLRQFHELEILLEKSKYIFIVDQETDQSNESDNNTVEPDREVLGQVSKVVISLKISTACLMDLLPSMENTLNYTDLKNCNAYSSQLLPFEVSDPAQPYVLNVLDRFSKADARLVKRLGEANWQRHTALRDVHGAEIQYGNPTEEVAPEIQIVPKSIFIPVSLFHDSGLGSSLPAQSNYAASVASHSSFVSSLADRNDGSLRVPSTPIEVFEGKPFKCQICGHVLSRIKNRVDWKRHVFADLKPYICTSALCSDELLMFPTRKLWETHEFTEHRVDRTWNCSKCPDQFPLVSKWRTHLAEKHSIEFTEIQSHHAERVAERVFSHPKHIQQCPLCLCTLGKSKRQFVTHVGKHMESIALAALPRELTSDSEKSSTASDENPTQTRTDQIHGMLHLQSMQEQEWLREETNYAENKELGAKSKAVIQTEVRPLIKTDNTTPTPKLPTLACPFYKMSLSKSTAVWKDLGYQPCGRLRLNSIRDLKQHLKRRHWPVQCSNCYQIFSGSDPDSCMLALESHLKLPIPCQLPDSVSKEGVDDTWWNWIKRPQPKKESTIEMYWEIWDKIFPDQPRPRTPWIIDDSWLEEDEPSRVNNQARAELDPLSSLYSASDGPCVPKDGLPADASQLEKSPQPLPPLPPPQSDPPLFKPPRVFNPNYTGPGTPSPLPPSQSGPPSLNPPRIPNPNYTGPGASAVLPTAPGNKNGSGPSSLPSFGQSNTPQPDDDNNYGHY